MEKSKIKNDIKLVCLLLLLTAVILAVFLTFAKKGKNVAVILDGEEKFCYNIDKDLTISIDSQNGHVNVLEIKNGKATVISADCPDKICVSHRSISKVGETIVCLPNKVVIEIKE